MRRWHNELAFMERQRKMDLADHRSSALRRGRAPDDFECICKVSRGIFRKHKQWACSCYMCRCETALRRLTRNDRRREQILRLRIAEQLGESMLVPGTRCPNCNRLTDDQTVINNPEEVQPKPGDFMICAYCAELQRVTDAMGLRKCKPEELMELEDEQRYMIHKAQSMLRKSPLHRPVNLN